MPGERLQTVLARAGLGSRRAADRWIAEGRVLVNDTVATPGIRVDPARDRVTLNGRPVELGASTKVHLAIHKPRGVLSSAHAAYGHAAVVDLFDPRPDGRLWPAGRLDLDSEGLMLLTNDGSWAHRVLHPRFGHVRRYAVQLDREPHPDDLDRLEDGVELDGEMAALLSVQRGRRPTQVEPLDPGPWFLVQLGEGRNREVRRLFATVGYRVRRLVRIGYGPITLAGLEPGAWRALTAAEVADLGGSAAPEAADRPRRASAGRLVIAVDGTSGSGKSTVGRALAERLGARFVDTGLLYRAVTLATLEAGIDPGDGPAVAHLARTTRIKVQSAVAGGEAEDRVTIGRRDVTTLLREPRIERAVPLVSQHPEVRAAMLTVQRDAARDGDTVMVGRDIGTVVLPDADLKVFLTASVDTRARRRAAQMGTPGRLEAYEREITERDRTDSTRAVAPLRRAPGALVLDTGELDVDGCVAAIVAALPPRAGQ
jgi:cytidylate kinase